MILDYETVLQLKQAVKAACGATLHFHDRCGGQSFSLETDDPAVRAAVIAAFEGLNMQVRFSDDGLTLTVADRK